MGPKQDSMQPVLSYLKRSKFYLLNQQQISFESSVCLDHFLLKARPVERV